MTLWTAAAARAATGGQTALDWTASGVSIDTRSLQPGDLFVALKDMRDGHDFVADALAKGAAAALVSRVPDGVPDTAPLLIVDDVLDGLTALARAARERTGAKVIAVTGSVGKTSTKEMLRAALARRGPLHAAEASFNNHWGVPLTLARMPQDTVTAIIEIGMNHPGEIAPLAQLAKPDIALITAIAAAHLEAFDGLSGIAREKASIYTGLGPGGVAIYPADAPHAALLSAAAPGAQLTFAVTGDADITAKSIRVAEGKTLVEAANGPQDILFKLHSPGPHFASNALGVLAVARALDDDVPLAALDLGIWHPPAGRGGIERRWLDPADEHSWIDLIDDAYNANPASMAASLATLASLTPTDGIGRVGQGRRIAVLGEMLELGEDSAKLHADIANLAAMEQIDTIHCAGPATAPLYQALPAQKRGLHTEIAAEIADQIGRLIDPGDILLVKGSNGSRVARVVDVVRKLSHPQGDPS